MTVFSKLSWIGGTISGIYILSKYAQYKWNDVLQQRSKELAARQNLKYRFELNLKDVGFVVESLLPSLKDKLFEEVNIELLTARLKENQKAKGNKEEIKKSKHLLWNDIKINSFVRTISAVYLVNLVAVLTCTQLSLLGRLSYLESVFAIKEKNNSVESHGKPADFISEQEERHYLTLSWYLMNVGWKKCIERVKDAVEVVVGGWPLTHSITHDSIIEIVRNVRNIVEKDDSGKPFRFDTFLLPTEGHEATVLAEGGLSDRLLEGSLKEMIEETRDFLESDDLLVVLDSTLEESFTLLIEQFKPAFFDQIVVKPSISRGISFAAGDDCESPSSHDQASKSFPLAGILPLISKTAQSIIIGVPNIFSDVVLNNPKLLTFGTVVYSSW